MGGVEFWRGFTGFAAWSRFFVHRGGGGVLRDLAREHGVAVVVGSFWARLRSAGGAAGVWFLFIEKTTAGAVQR